MSNLVYIYSTASQSTAYTLYTKNAGGIPVAGKSIEIKGGAHVADKHLVTPYGVVTTVTQEEYELLKQNRSFNTHLDAGFLKVGKSKTDPEKVAKDMTTKDKSAQPTEEELLNKTESISETLTPAGVEKAVVAAKKSGKK